MWVIKFLYSINIVISITLQAFPANIIIEGYVFGKMEKSTKKTWLINFQRIALIALSVVICIVLGDSLDKFNSLIGTFAATPVVFTIPCIMHMYLCNPTRLQMILNWGVIVFSVIVLFFCSGFTIWTWND